MYIKKAIFFTILVSLIISSSLFGEIKFEKNISKDLFSGSTEKDQDQNNNDPNQQQNLNDLNKMENEKATDSNDKVEDPNAVLKENAKVDEVKKPTLSEEEQKDADGYLEAAQTMFAYDSLSDGDDIAMLKKAITASYLFEKAGQKASMQKIHYLLAQMYIRFEAPSLAISHARKCIKSTEVKLDDIEMAYGFEILARSHAANGDTDKAKKYIDFAKRAAENIRNPETKQNFLDDFENEPWFGLSVK